MAPFFSHLFSSYPFYFFFFISVDKTGEFGNPMRVKLFFLKPSCLPTLVFSPSIFILNYEFSTFKLFYIVSGSNPQYIYPSFS